MRGITFVILLLFFLTAAGNAFARTQSDFPNAKHGIITEMRENTAGFLVITKLENFYNYAASFQDNDCFNDLSEYHELYNALTGELVLTSPHESGYGLCYTATDLGWLIYPNVSLPSGKYWVHYKSTADNAEWITDNFDYIAPIPTPTPLNIPPTAIISTSLTKDGKLQLDGSLSSDPMNKPLTFSWQIGAETHSRTGKWVAIDDLSPGDYLITLTVTNGQTSATAKSKIGIPAQQTKPNISLHVDNLILNTLTGEVVFKGTLATTNPLFQSVIKNPSVRVALAFQNNKNQSHDPYGVIGVDSIKLTTVGKVLK